MSPEVLTKRKEMRHFQENKLHWHGEFCCSALCPGGAALDMLSKKGVCFLLWEPLFSCRALLLPQALTCVPLQQPGWKRWYSPGSAWISMQRPFSLHYSSRTHELELCWISLLHLQLLVPHQQRLVCLSKCRSRNASLVRSKQMSFGDRDIGKGHYTPFCAWSKAWDRILSLIIKKPTDQLVLQ